MKRNVLASFTNVLLMPVTIVPRTVGALVTTGGTAAVNGIAMLNPQRWVGGQKTNSARSEGYSKSFEDTMDDGFLNDDEDEDEERLEKVENEPKGLTPIGDVGRVS
jgi:recyclin-1